MAKGNRGGKRGTSSTVSVDSEMQSFIYDYTLPTPTGTGYKFTCEYTQGIVDGDDAKINHAKQYELLQVGSWYTDDEKDAIKVANDEHIRKAEKLLDLVQHSQTNTTLYRIENGSHQTFDIKTGNTTTVYDSYSVGDTISFGVRSTTASKSLIQDVLNGTDENLTGKKGFCTVYEIVGKKTALNIQKYSAYKYQEEYLMSGKFKVKSVTKNSNHQIVRIEQI